MHRPAPRCRVTVVSFYALSRARCLCTSIGLWTVACTGFLWTLSCEVPMHCFSEQAFVIQLTFLCTLSCEVPMHSGRVHRRCPRIPSFYALSRARCLCTSAMR